MQLLLTAFEPFDASGRNSSLEACRLYLESVTPPCPLRFEVLPVVFGEDTRRMETLLAEFPADAVLHVGQAARTSALRVEAQALNRRYAEAPTAAPLSGIAPVSQRTEERVPILADAPLQLPSTLPVQALVEALQEAGLAAELSQDAGSYLCNHVLYQSLHRAAATGRPRVGFLHVPQGPEQVGTGQPSMPVPEIARGLQIIIALLASHHGP